MIKNYLISTLRYFAKYRSYAIFNVMGLSVGLACFALIGLWVLHELSFDRFHSKSNRIYRVSAIFTSASQQTRQAVTSVPLRLALKEDFPEVEEAIIIDKNDAMVQRGEKKILEDDLLMTEPAFFDLFDFNMLAGDEETALREPYSIVLSETMAAKYFGDENPIGQSLVVFLQDPEGKGKSYTVTGVVEDCPLNSHFTYQALISFSTLEVNNAGNTDDFGWFNNGYYTYALLQHGAHARDLEQKLPSFVEKYMGTQNREWGVEYEYFLQPLNEIHLTPDIKYEIERTSHVTNVIIFASVGLIVLVLACINYVNMATAFVSGRFKEVGMRKIMGAYRHQLVLQHLVESTLLSLSSLALGIVWIELTRPAFESITGLPIQGLYTIPTLTSLFLIATSVGLASGLYPALFLSGLKPLSTVKGQVKSGMHSGHLRKSLMVIQYTVSILLVVGIIVVRSQLSFMQSKDLGFNHEALLIMGVNGSTEVMSGYDAFKNELLSLGSILGVTRSNTFITGGLGNSMGVVEHASGEKVNASVHRVRTDFDYLNVYQMTLQAGRFFDPANAADSLYSFVVNEAFAKAHGYRDPQDILGKDFQFVGRDGQVVGVVKDFHYNSLQHSVQPTCLYLLRGNFSRIAVRLNGNLNDSKHTVEQLWQKHFPNTVLHTWFADEAVEAQYQSEQRFSKIILSFSVISLVIACVGLFALVSYSIENRVKEIGIRKVLGASMGHILSLLSKEFLTLMLISVAIAIPFGHYLMTEWLSAFAYRIEPGGWVYVTAAGLVILAAWLTISVRSIRAATANPVESLRTE